jgi:hypothetical protein
LFRGDSFFVFLISNERTKLLASGLNSAAAGCFTAGVITTIGALVLDLPPTREHWAFAALVSLIWLLVAINLHVVGQLVLGWLQE